MGAKLRRALVVFLAVSIPIVVTLVLLEGVSRLVLPAYLPPHPRGLHVNDPELGYRYAPNFTGRINWWRRHPIRIRTNSVGLRDRDYGVRGSDVARVLMIGDSQTFGMVEERSSLPRLLERALNGDAVGGEDAAGDRRASDAQPPRFEVINAGVMGYGTEQEAVLFRRLIPIYRPDIVVLTFFPNDVEDDAAGALSHYRVWPDGYLHDLTKPRDEENRDGVDRWLETHVNLFRLSSMAASELRARAGAALRGRKFTPAPYEPPAYVRRLLSRQWDEKGCRNWARTDSLIAGFLQCARDSNVAAVVLDGGSREGIGWRVWPAETDTASYDLDRVSGLLDGIADRCGAICVHIQPSFRADRDPESLLLPNDEHWSPAGNRKVAAILAPVVRRLIGDRGR